MMVLAPACVQEIQGKKPYYYALGHNFICAHYLWRERRKKRRQGERSFMVYLALGGHLKKNYDIYIYVCIIKLLTTSAKN